MCTTGMYTLLSSMSIGYNDILNKKKEFDHHAFSFFIARLQWVSYGLHNRAALEILLGRVLPENSFFLMVVSCV